MAPPVTPDCPLRCLALSTHVLNRLRSSYEVLDRPPRTVGDLLVLREEEKLRYIRGIGPGRLGEIEAALERAGLLTEHEHAPHGESAHGHGERGADGGQ